jgi:integrase/recombinase XerD
VTTTDTLRSPIGPAITDYLSLKRALGRRFTNEAYVLHCLDQFLATAASTCPTLTAESFAAWCLTLAHLSPTTRRARMRIVRNLCLHVRRGTPTCFVPDDATFPAIRPARRPHIFSEEQIARLLQVAAGLPARSTSPLRGPTCRLAIVLLYTCGLRRGELVRLLLSDYDPGERTLLIRASKFHKSRLVALSNDASRELDRYLVARRRLKHAPEDPLLIRSGGGLRPRSGGGFRQSMRSLFLAADVRTVDGALPRVHDLRHTHAVHALLRWYRAGVDVQARLPALATSMGHVSVVSTAYYVKLLEPVMQAASERFATHVGSIIAPPAKSGGDL